MSRFAMTYRFFLVNFLSVLFLSSWSSLTQADEKKDPAGKRKWENCPKPYLVAGIESGFTKPLLQTLVEILGNTGI